MSYDFNRRRTDFYRRLTEEPLRNRAPPDPGLRVLKSQRAVELDHTCLGMDTFSCGGCSSVIMCTAGRAYIQPCHMGTSCVFHNAFQSSVCHSKGDSRCKCKDGQDEVVPDPYDPAAYLICQTGKTSPIVGVCQNGEEYDHKTLKCRSRPKFPTCDHVGVFVNKDDCRWYQICVPSGDGKFRGKYLRCSNPEHVYSESKRQCDDPKTLNPSDPCAELPKRLQYTCAFWVILLAQLYPPAYDKFCEIKQVYS